MRIRSGWIACLGAVALVACQSTGNILDTKAKKGAILGALAGAAAGAAIGGHEHRAGGALIGAAAGAMAGGLIGRYLDQQAAELDAIPGAEIERRDDSILVNFQSQMLFDTGSSNLHPGAYDRLAIYGKSLDNSTFLSFLGDTRPRHSTASRRLFYNHGGHRSSKARGSHPRSPWPLSRGFRGRQALGDHRRRQSGRRGYRSEGEGCPHVSNDNGTRG